MVFFLVISAKWRIFCFEVGEGGIHDLFYVSCIRLSSRVYCVIAWEKRSSFPNWKEINWKFEYMQTRKQKEEIVGEVTDRIRESKSLVFAKYTGLSVKESMDLQRKLRKEGGSVRVMKKTLLSIALKSADLPVDARTFDGQTLTAFSPDEVTAAKALVEFSKEHPALVVEAGLLGEKLLSAEEVVSLSKLPSLIELRATLAGTLQAPISGFVRTLSGNMSGLVRVLRQVAEAK